MSLQQCCMVRKYCEFTRKPRNTNDARTDSVEIHLRKFRRCCDTAEIHDRSRTSIIAMSLIAFCDYEQLIIGPLQMTGR